MVPVVYLVSYPVIYLIIKTIFIKEYEVNRLKTRVYLFNYLYKIRVILAVRVLVIRQFIIFAFKAPFK